MFGRGKVIWGTPVADVLAAIGLPPDVVSVQLDAGGTALQWIHRRIDGANAYFLSNQRQDKPLQTDVSFRIDGMIPEFWHADTGKLEQAPIWRREGGRTIVPIALDQSGSVFVVFRKPIGNTDPIVAVEKTPADSAMILTVNDGGVATIVSATAGTFSLRKASGNSLTAKILSVPAPIEIEGPWEVRFPASWGAPDKINMQKLASWTENSDAGVKYFSGTATYVKEVDLDAALLAPGRTIVLKLGEVQRIATVRINGKELGVLWKPPFEVDVTSALKSGHNLFEISVTNFWVNRLIGDEQQPDDARWNPGRGREGTPAFPTTATANAPARGPAGGVALATIPEWLLNGQARPSKNRYTFTSYKFYGKDSPLLRSGLLGPVKLEFLQTVNAE